MTQRADVYGCRECGQVVTVVHAAAGRLVCCNRPMQPAGAEREIPVGAGAAGSPYWRCSNCRYILRAEMPPEVCPSCHQSCQFLDVTCYIPECGFTGIDERLV